MWHFGSAGIKHTSSCVEIPFSNANWYQAARWNELLFLVRLTRGCMSRPRSAIARAILKNAPILIPNEANEFAGRQVRTRQAILSEEKENREEGARAFPVPLRLL